MLKQGVDLGQVYQTLQAFMGGYFVNYFNRFGRQWQVYVEAEGKYRTTADNVRQFYVNNDKGDPVPLICAHDHGAAAGPRIHHALQPLPVRADQRHAASRVIAPGR